MNIVYLLPVRYLLRLMPHSSVLVEIANIYYLKYSWPTGLLLREQLQFITWTVHPSHRLLNCGTFNGESGLVAAARQSTANPLKVGLIYIGTKFA